MVNLYRVTALLSAALLFMAQPLFARLVLPLVGGAPAVWNTCQVFFQVALLAGYLYAHASSQWLGTRVSALGVLPSAALGAVVRTHCFRRASALSVASACHRLVVTSTFLALPVSLSRSICTS